MKTTPLLIWMLGLTVLAHGQETDKAAASGQIQTPSAVSDNPTIPTLPDVNPELLKTVIADQWDRGMDMFGGRPRTTAIPPD